MCAASYIYTNITIHPETVRQIHRPAERNSKRERERERQVREGAEANGESSVWALLIFAIIH